MPTYRGLTRPSVSGVSGGGMAPHFAQYRTAAQALPRLPAAAPPPSPVTPPAPTFDPSTIGAVGNGTPFFGPGSELNFQPRMSNETSPVDSIGDPMATSWLTPGRQRLGGAIMKMANLS